MNPLLASWTDIAGIARQLPKLVKLNVRYTHHVTFFKICVYVNAVTCTDSLATFPCSENTQMVFQHDVGLLDAFKPLKALYLNKMKLRIEQVRVYMYACSCILASNALNITSRW